MLTRFGVIGDVHAEDDALAAAIDFLEREKVDRILAVGDLVDGRGDVNRVVRLLREHDVPTVRGNHERWFLGGGFDELPMATRREELDDAGETWAFLAALPATRRFDTVAGSLLLCHGVGDDDMALLRDFDDGYALESNDALQRLLSSTGAPAFVACGHTHRRMCAGSAARPS